MMTSDEYAKKKGAYCPVCGSEDLSVGDTEPFEGGMAEDVVCNGCGASWMDHYKLVGYVQLELLENNG